MTVRKERLLQVVMIEPRHPNAQREFAASRRSNSGRRREKVLTVSCRPDCFSREGRFINMEIARDGLAWRCVQYDKPEEFTAVANDACESAAKGDPTSIKHF